MKIKELKKKSEKHCRGGLAAGNRPPRTIRHRRVPGASILAATLPRLTIGRHDTSIVDTLIVFLLFVNEYF